MRRGVLEARGIVFGYGDEPILNGVDLQLGDGDVVVVYGPTGSGKTTLLLVLAGLLKPWRGELYFMGQPMDGVRARRYIGIAFQNPDDMFFNSTVFDEIAYTPARLYGAEEGRRLAKEVAEKLGVVHLLDRPPYKLSGGQKKLASIAAAVAHSPRLVFLDEPTAYLDADTAERVIQLVEELRGGGTAFVVATHDLELLCRLQARAYRLEEGRLIEGAPAEENSLSMRPGLRIVL
jgi:cobalt/nickel transport system ATP-binding protein